MKFEDRLIDILLQNRIECTPDQASLFVRYYELLIEKNKVMNLTAITDFDDVVLKHFADSLSICRIMALSNQRVIDVGTGAGFPGIPLKILYPDLKITLLDSLQKRLNFLDEVIDELKLKDIFTLHARAEEAGRNPEYREKYDLCVSRAVANLSTLVEYCLPFVSVGGYFVSYKSMKAHEELTSADKAISILGGSLSKVDTFSFENTDIDRSLIMIKKVSSTSLKYPRSGGKPSSNPLC